MVLGCNVVVLGEDWVLLLVVLKILKEKVKVYGFMVFDLEFDMIM